MSTIHNNTTPPPVRYISVPSQQDGWLVFRAIHQVSKLSISSKTWTHLLSQFPTLANEFTEFLREMEMQGMLFECRPTINGSTPFEFAVGPAPRLEKVTEADPGPFNTHLFGSKEARQDCKDDADDMDIDWQTDSDERVGGDGGGGICSWNRSDSNSESSESSSESDKELSIGCVFSNLTGDATLVAPRPASAEAAKDGRFAHLANYLKHTSPEEAGKLWTLVAIEYEYMLSTTGKDQLVYLSTHGLGVSFLHFRLEHSPKYYNYKAFTSGSPADVMSDSTPLQIQIASDLHTEFYGLSAGSAPRQLIIPRAPVLALLGDIGNAFSDSLRAFLHHQADNFEKVLFIIGNHELYNARKGQIQSVTEQWAWLKSVCEERDNIYLLEKDSIDLCGIRILATSLWSDIPDDMLQGAEMVMNDYALSYNHKDGEAPRKLTASETRQWYRENRQWLRGELDRARQEGIPTLVLTHHTPQMKGTSHPRYSSDPLTCCFSSDLTELLSFPVKAWACGHTHFNFDMHVGGTRLVSNQRGYKGQAKSDYRRDGLVLHIHPVL